MENKNLQSYDKDSPVQNEFLSIPSETDNLIVVNESICLYD
ncbi:MAG: hypothetical protein WC494_00235 [Candidatus Pacearchaeota archaeon]